MSDIEFKLTDNSDKVFKVLVQALDGSLEECGLAAERFAKIKCPVDTGRLRNSITHAVGGKPAAISSYHAEYGSNTFVNKEGKRKRYRATSKNAGTVSIGRYSGNAPADKPGEKSVWIGTNVEYAEKIELGGSNQAPNGFLRRAITEHRAAFEKIIKSWLKKEI